MIDRSLRQLARTFIVLACLAGAATGVVHFMEGPQGIPLAGGILLAAFALMKANLVIDDFLGLRNRGGLRIALMAWPLLFAVSALLRAVFSGVPAL